MTTWMLYAGAFGMLVLMAAIALDRGVRAIAGQARFIWLAALVVAAAAPWALPTLSSDRPADAPIAVAAQTSTVSAAVSSPSRVAPAVASLSERLEALDRPVAALWMVLTLLLTLRFARSVLALRREQAHWVAREIDGTPVLITPGIGPAVVALPRPRILLPEWALSLDPASLATVIRHERQHTAAGDAWLIITGAVIAAALPWNPAVWLICRRLRLALEMDCDARVLAEEGRVDRYGSLLLAIAQRPGVTTSLAATLTESPADLERRIDAMTTRPPRNPRLRAGLFGTAGAAVMMVALGLPSPDVGPRKATAAGIAQGRPQQAPPQQSAVPDSSNRPPRYPDSLRARGIQGIVIAKFVVDTTGRIEARTFEVVRSDHPALTEAVRDHIPNLRFSPATVGGRRVRQLVQMPFTFSLLGGSAPPARGGADGLTTVGVTATRPVLRSEMPGSSTPAIAAPPRADTQASLRAATAEPDEVARAVSTNLPPVYPVPLRAANIEGQVVASFVIGADGKADLSTFQVRRSDHDAFTAAVREALGRMSFYPAKKSGVAVASTVTMPFQFSLIR